MNRSLVLAATVLATVVVAAVLLAQQQSRGGGGGGVGGVGGVGIVMFSTPNIVPDYAWLAAHINKAYADRHGYAFEHHIRSDAFKVPQWEKVRVIRDALNRYDSVFWIDSDAVFNQHETSLDRWLDSPVDFLGCSDYPNGPYSINTGTLLVKSTPWSRQFFDLWWSMRRVPKYQKWANEQEALHDLILRNAYKCDGKMEILPCDEFNSSYNDIVHGKRRDTFVLHFMSMNSAIRRSELQAVRRRVGV